MATFHSKWRDLSIAHKLSMVIGIMAVLIVVELASVRFAMRSLGATRAFIAGEGMWSKAQKDALFHLNRYVATHSQEAYDAFQLELAIPDGDHIARVEMQKANYDPAMVRKGFLQGGIHTDDIQPMVELLLRFNDNVYIKHAIAIWADADAHLEGIKAAAAEYHDMVRTQNQTRAYEPISDRISALNAELTLLEEDFSNTLGEASRWLEHVVLLLLSIAVVSVAGIGLTLAFMTSRSISSGLSELNETARRIGHGDLDSHVVLRSQDEIGQLGQSVNDMARMLRDSYRQLEARVNERTDQLHAVAAQNAELYAKADVALKQRDELFSIASHELRTPLGTLCMQLELLSEKAITPTVNAQIDRSLRMAKQLSALVDELLDLTRVQRGTLQIHPQKCDLTALVDDAVVAFAPEAKKYGAEVSVVAPCPVFGELDPTRILQVVTNLVSNAIKYGGGSPIELTVEARGPSVMLSVHDSGPGIPPEACDRIFECFERASCDPRVGGFGLGLYISRQIVTAHGGTLALETHLGAGSTFTVELPAIAQAKIYDESIGRAT